MKYFLMLNLMFGMIASLSAQTTVIHLNLDHSKSSNCLVVIPDIKVRDDYTTNQSLKPALKNNHTANIILNILRPTYLIIYFNHGDIKTPKYFSYNFYVSPGDNIYFKADFNKSDYGLNVSGKGCANNQPLLANIAQASLDSFYGDTVPDRAIVAINRQCAENDSILAKYLKLYKPTSDFISATKNNFKYYALGNYFMFKENNKFSIGQAYDHNFSKWNSIQDSLLAKAPLNNNSALNSCVFETLLPYYLLREKEYLWSKSTIDPALFYKEWYGLDIKEGSKALEDDRVNILEEKIIDRFFSGRTAEFLYATLFDQAISESNYKNIPKIYTHFKSTYPNSGYVNIFKPLIENIQKNERNVLDGQMIFIPDDTVKFNNLNDILNLVHGKTVILDMWGTWCGPCREELEKFAPVLKAHFEGRDLTYLYIANDDLNHLTTWKSLIAYYNLTGIHILANDKLKSDIMIKVKSKSFPTYIIIKKDGTYTISKAGYPLNVEVLINELENAMTNN